MHNQLFFSYIYHQSYLGVWIFYWTENIAVLAYSEYEFSRDEVADDEFASRNIEP